jgi:hypothetical protein
VHGRLVVDRYTTTVNGTAAKEGTVTVAHHGSVTAGAIHAPVVHHQAMRV